MNGLIVGCPVYDRAWVLEDWFDRVQAWEKGVGGIHFVFALTPGTDDTYGVISRRTSNATVIEVTEGMHSRDRDWNRVERVETMAATRNRLLKWVRHLMRVKGADGFLSLDSDILLPDWAQGERLMDNLRSKDAVSPLVYLGPGMITNVFTDRGGVYRRVRDNANTGSASILCAAILMSPQLVLDEEVVYGFNRRGEDFAWSESARMAGHTLGYDFGVKCKHIMEPDQLERMDKRVGW